MRRLVVALFASALALAALGPPALGHERRAVGPYQLVVGFLAEPAFTGIPNGVDLRVTEVASNTPVEGLQDTLQVEVLASGQTQTFKLRTRFGQPGAYAADFVPTRAATYLFRFFGKIKDRDVNERFESGPGRFDEPHNLAELQFPPGDETAGRLDAIQSTADQTRLLALAALVVALAGSGLALFRRV